LLELAAELEAERDHALDRPEKEGEGILDMLDEQAVREANKAENASDDMLPGSAALEANASFDRVLYDGGEFGLGGAVGSVEEQDFLGLPGLLEADEVALLLRYHQAQHAQRPLAPAPAADAEDPPERAERRKRTGVR